MEDRISNQADGFGDIEKAEQGDSDTIINEPPTSIHLDATSPITYLYLTWSTSLPSPPPNAPPLPNLKPYSDPLLWSAGRKNILLGLTCIATFLTAYSAGSYSPPARLMAETFGATHMATLGGISTFCAGFALAPMALAPISEIVGRYPVFVIAGFGFVLSEAICSLVTTLAGMLIARLFAGTGASVFSSVIGGVIADLWDKEERNTPMALFSGSVLLGTGAGPLVASAMIEGIGQSRVAWQWTFWHQVISGGVLLLLFVVFFKETRGSVLLSRKAAKLNTWYEKMEDAGVYGVYVKDGDAVMVPSAETSLKTPPTTILQRKRIRWIVAADEQRTSLGRLISTSVRRPFYLFFTEPVVFAFSLWAAFAWAVLYLAFAVVPYLHGRDFSASYKTYVAMMVGTVAATALGIWQERLLRHPQWRGDVAPREGYSGSKVWGVLRRKFPAEAPEARLYFSCVTALLLPIGLFIAFLPSGTSVDTAHDDGGVALAIGLGLATWGIYAIYLASFNYLADTYHIYASSALAAQGCARNLLGGAFPLVTASMFDGMGLRGGGGMLAGVGCVLTVIPWVLVFWGETIRGRSKTALSLQKLET